jgi:hypothetical protein
MASAADRCAAEHRLRITDIEYKNEKETLKNEYVRRLRLILNTELSVKKKNKMKAIGTLAEPVIIYSFGIINWNQEEIQKKKKTGEKKAEKC